MLYFRFSENQRLVSFTTLADTDTIWPHGGRVSDAFIRWFPLGQRIEASAHRDDNEQWKKHRYDFADVMRSLSTELVGREHTVMEVLTWQRAQRDSGGLLWIGGEPGIGKSALAAELVRKMAVDGALCVVPFFFRGGDARCHPDRFFEAATMSLQRWTKTRVDAADETPESLFLKTLDQFTSGRRENGEAVVFILDGLDEVVGVNSSFVTLPLKLIRPRVIWICLAITRINVSHR